MNTQQHNKSITINELINILRVRKWFIIISLLSTLTPVIIYNFKAIPIYRASTKVIFEDTDRDLGYNFLGGFKQNFIANQIEEMKTKSFAQEVYEALSPQHVKKFLTLSTYRPEYDRSNFIVGQIQSNLSFTPIRGTEVITISFESQKRELAQIVANTTANVLIKRNLEVRRQQYSNVRKFVEEQFEIVKKRLEEAEKALKEFKEKENIASLEDESKEILERITQAEVAYNEVKSQKQELQKRLSVIQEQLAGEQKELSTNVVKTTSPMMQKLKERLVELEIMYTNLQVQGFPENNPKMRDIRKEIKQVKQNLIDETFKINQNISSLIDPFSQIKKYLEESISLDVELKALEAKEKNLKSLLDNYSQMLKKLPQKEMQLIRLMRDKEVNNKLYMTLLEEKEKARIQEASELGNIRILEKARLPVSPIKPRRLLNIILAIILGSFLAFTLIFIFEYYNDVIKTQEEVEKELGIPVLTTIPKLKFNFDELLDFSKNGNTFLTKAENSILFDSFSLLSFVLDQKTQNSTTIMLTSSIPNEGKSTVASLLAISCAQRGKKTLLIDGDLRKPTLHNLFGVPREPGLTNMAIEFMQIVKKLNANENNVNGHVLNNHDQEVSAPHFHEKMLNNILNERLTQTIERNLLFLPSGFVPPNPVRVWSTDVWNQIFDRLKQLVDIIIIDCPPIGVAETTMMPLYIDKILFCVAAGEMERKALKRSFKMFTETIANTKDKITGVVLNKADIVNLYGGYKYYKYYFKKDKFKLAPELPKADFT